MNSARRVANPPVRPVMLFDGDCRFCRMWIQRWRQSTGERVEYRELQSPSVAEEFPDLPRAELEKAVHFIAGDGSIYRGAEAVFRSLAVDERKQWLARLYDESPAFARLTESTYGFVAGHRQLFSRLTRMLWGEHVERSPEFLTRWIFLRGLGLIYLIAFVSFWVQVNGLIGHRGILPVSELMSEAHRAVEARGIGLDRFRLLPTLCWFFESDGALQIQCGLGTLLALALTIGIAPPICLGGLWILYLSLVTAGQDFMGFQWDNLLLETGLLALFFAPFQLLPRPAREKPPSRAGLWLLRLLLFKLMFLSGVVKLSSGDPLWRNLTALTRHYETQPLPNFIAWHLHQMPLWFHKTSCALMFGIELIAPFLLFLPRRPRMLGGLALALLQVGILLTGNYTFFNWLTLVLCVVAFDDFTWARILPTKLASNYGASPRPSALPAKVLAAAVASISIVQVISAFRPTPFWASPIVAVNRWVAPFRSVSPYGLFAVMTPDRPEIVVEGSADGREWKEYSFRYKPGALNRRPSFVAPHQPRLDWQMWFAALGQARENPWFVNFCARLLEGAPETLELLETNPFPNAPPKYVRARLYLYHFTTREERRRTGHWWQRELKGEYLPAISLDDLQRARSQVR